MTVDLKLNEKEIFLFQNVNIACFGRCKKHLKGLILAQNERWRRGLGMQVEREFDDGSFG